MALQEYAPKEQMKHDPSTMYKMGYTHHDDANLRQEDDYGKTPLARDFEVITLWSGWFTQEQRIKLEEWFKTKYPKNVWTKEAYNGITECRAFSYLESKALSDLLYKAYPPYNYTKAKGLDHVYYQMLRKKPQMAAVAAK